LHYHAYCGENKNPTLFLFRDFGEFQDGVTRMGDCDLPDRKQLTEKAESIA